MRIAVGADHAGFQLKEVLANYLVAQGYDVQDFGTFSDDAVDYPDFAEKVATAVARGEAERGLLVCGTGLGMSITANKVRGVRAAVAHDVVSARLARQHNDANVLTMGGRLIAAPLAQEILTTFLQTKFEGGRHQRRIEKIQAVERETPRV